MKHLLIGSLGLLLAASACTATPETPATPTSKVEETPREQSVDTPAKESSTIAEQSSATGKSGQFVDGEHPTSGTVNLVKKEDGYYLEFAGDFRSDSGPDLTVILHRSADVIGETSAPAHAIAEADYAFIGELQTTNGTQTYKIPENIEVSQYQSVAIWCRRFNATFGSAALQ